MKKINGELVMDDELKLAPNADFLLLGKQAKELSDTVINGMEILVLPEETSRVSVLNVVASLVSLEITSLYADASLTSQLYKRTVLQLHKAFSAEIEGYVKGTSFKDFCASNFSIEEFMYFNDLILDYCLPLYEGNDLSVFDSPMNRLMEDIHSECTFCDELVLGQEVG